ncbi:outer membrane protein assembly factor BamC [Blochmannia endosymbiont of Camponotus sp. C-046]|uniref:outer membrane protein assembly factor BamC n=1 Tax=Blochmannia endosymbiont of Camponotus sp. C-046 TaxID=2945589 RepID=UPI002023F849|nr:outer membrane protein assembly factor BamC [Blochmannia endosymbiont of Camponotus sp. C-046]URJ28793.1 outer membrane protein assembly factor BamC [Blochmannia endosymbiont of Camponotus sp. C-046]
MLIFLEILSVILLSACSFGTYKESRCKLNGDLSYLDTTSLVELNIPKDLDVALPISYDDYVVPNINIGDQEVGKQLNICPPLILSTDVLNESCLINVED